MKPQEAREILQNYINKRIIRHGNFVLPIDDVIVKSYTAIGSRSFIGYTWKYLIQIAYNLKPES
jgi:imidazoleglycerol phosphate dehydratase HisB